MNDLKALILCGGKSSRLGIDKLSVIKEGLSLAHWWKNKLKKYCSEVYFSCNEELQTKYSLYPTIIDEEKHQGPLGGICKYIKEFPHTPVLIVAVDLVHITESEIEELISKRDMTKSSTCFLENESKRIFPLFSILEPSIFRKCLQEYQNAGKSLFSVLNESQTKAIHSNHNFIGINTPNDLEQYLALQKKK